VGEIASKKRVPLRATPDRWVYKTSTNDGKTKIESMGSIDPSLGEAIRVLQLHITNLTPDEKERLVSFMGQVRERLKAARGGER